MADSYSVKAMRSAHKKMVKSRQGTLAPPKAEKTREWLREMREGK